jgi:pimeloyl-ACP methyl ester carboxylesterase
MAFFERDGARIYFEDTGSGEPIIAVHGLIENTSYWRLAGVAGALEKKHRLVSMDMRAHGRTTVPGDRPGFDVDTMGDDIIALADHLGLRCFHLLSHSTGGFISVRLAMRERGRIAALILTDTGSFTTVVNSDAETIAKWNNKMARSFEKIDWDRMIAGVRVVPGPFFRGIAESERCDELLALALEMIGVGNRDIIASFVRAFYTDPDQRIEGLRSITCPVLIVYGEKDDLFIQSSRLMAKEIPGAKLLEYPGVGHMTALEAPERLAADVLDFLAAHPLQ